MDHAGQALRLLVDHFNDLFALLFRQGVATHQLARSLNGGERRAHLVRDEVDGLLIVAPFGFRLSKSAAHHEMLIAGRGHRREPGRGQRREEREHDALPEQDIGRRGDGG